MKQILSTIFFSILLFPAFSQSGKVRGKVTSASTGEELIGAAVYVVEKQTGAATDIDGNYSITLAPGTYTLVCSYISYNSDTSKVTVSDGQIQVKDFALLDQSLSLDEFVVVAKEQRSTMNAMDMIKKKSATVMEGITEEQINRSGDNDAAAAAKKVTGVTVEGGRYVYIRGLSDRYSKTTLNGAEIPGLDPNRNTVQLNLFPSKLLQNMIIIKSFSPEYPGSFTGGLLNIETKDFPEKETFNFSTTFGFNTQANFNKEFIADQKNRLDLIGSGAADRALPSAILGIIPTPFTSADEDGKLTTMTQSFNKNWVPISKTPGLNQRYSASYGNQFEFKKKENRSIGFITGLSYNKNFEYYDNGRTGRFKQTGTYDQVDELNVDKEFVDRQGTEDVLWGALLNVSYKHNANNKIGLNLIRNQNGQSIARVQEGPIPLDNPDLTFQTRTLQYLQRSITSAQLKGEHLLSKKSKFEMNWLGSYTRSGQEQPDLRFFSNDYQLNSLGDTVYNINTALYTDPARFFRTMEENNIDTKINFELPFKSAGGKDSKLKFGVSNVFKKRTFSEKRFDFSSFQVDYQGNVSDYFSNQNMVSGTSTGFIYVVDATERRNSYIGTDNVAAGYVMADLYATSRLRVIVGARAEKTDILTYSLKQVNNDNDTGKLNNLDVLPALNASFALNEKSNFRFAYSRTIARPTFRELAPFASFSFVGDFLELGNGELERTLIDNLDLRIESFPKPGETYSFSLFAKFFTNPIERTFNPSAAASSPELTYDNVDNAQLFGAEFEFRRKLDFISSKLKNIEIGGNFAYVYSVVKIRDEELFNIRALNPNAEDTRTMFGQSPYIVNGFVHFEDDSTGWSAIATFNVSGERLAIVMSNGTPNVFDQPRPQLDLGISKKLNDNWTIRVRARNLLDPEYKMIHHFKGEEYVFQSYKIGRTFSLGISYGF